MPAQIIHVGGTGGRSRARAEAANRRRAEAWVERRRQERRAAAQAITSRLARERLARIGCKG
jgi:hypothetical protein